MKTEYVGVPEVPTINTNGGKILALLAAFFVLVTEVGDDIFAKL